MTTPNDTPTPSVEELVGRWRQLVETVAADTEAANHWTPRIEHAGNALATALEAVEERAQGFSDRCDDLGRERDYYKGIHDNTVQQQAAKIEKRDAGARSALQFLKDRQPAFSGAWKIIRNRYPVNLDEKQPPNRGRRHAMLKHYPHPILAYFEYDHLPENLQKVSQPLHDLAWEIAQNREAGYDEKTVGLRKLLEAKDCFVRSATDR